MSATLQVKAIISHLGKGLKSYEIGEGILVVEIPDHGSIVLRADERRNAIEISGVWPKKLNGAVVTAGPSPTVKCRLDRPPHKIAAEIERRFLPAWSEKYKRACEIRDGCEAIERAANATAVKVAKEFWTYPTAQRTFFSEGGGGGVRVSGSAGVDHVRLEVEGSPEKLKGVIAAIKEALKQ